MIDLKNQPLLRHSPLLLRNNDLLPTLVRSEVRGQAVLHHLNPPKTPEGQKYELKPENKDLKIVFKANAEGNCYYPYAVYDPLPPTNDAEDASVYAPGDYIAVPLQSTGADKKVFNAPTPVANIIGSTNDPKPIIKGRKYNKWIDIIRDVAGDGAASVCQVQPQIFLSDRSQVGTIAIFPPHQYLVGAHLTEGPENQRGEALKGDNVLLLAITNEHNVCKIRTSRQQNPTTGEGFYMLTILGAVGVELSGFMLG